MSYPPEYVCTCWCPCHLGSIPCEQAHGSDYLCVYLQGVLGHTLNPVRQLFERLASPSAADDAEMRFQHFKKHIWLRIQESGSSGGTPQFEVNTTQPPPLVSHFRGQYAAKLDIWSSLMQLVKSANGEFGFDPTRPSCLLIRHSPLGNVSKVALQAVCCVATLVSQFVMVALPIICCVARLG